MNTFYFRAVLLTVLLALTGCVTTGIKQRQDDVKNVLSSKASQPRLDAQAAASDLRKALLYNYGSLEGTELNSYLNRLLKRSLEASNIAADCCQVVLLNDPSLSAFAMKSGRIFVSAGWVAQADSEGELVGMLTHEAAHVLLHDFDSDSVAQGFTNVSMIFQIFGDENASLNSVLLDEISSNYLHPTWNREQENRADAFAIKTSINAGYSFSDSVRSVLDRLEQHELKQQPVTSSQESKFEAIFNKWKKRHASAAERTSSAIEYFKAEGKPVPKKITSNNEFGIIKNSNELRLLKDGYSLIDTLSVVYKRLESKHLIALKNQAARSKDLYGLLNICRLLQAGEQKTNCYKLSISLNKSSWYPYIEIARTYMQIGDRKNAISMIESGYTDLERPSEILPDIVGFFDKFDKNLMGEYLKICLGEGLNVYKRCSMQADVERKKTEGERNAKKIVDKLFRK